jgi:hypothetical protein
MISYNFYNVLVQFKSMFVTHRGIKIEIHSEYFMIEIYVYLGGGANDTQGQI